MECDRTYDYEIRQILPGETLVLHQLQARSWLATYPSEENGVSREWVEERTSSWLTPEKISESEEFLQTVLDDPNQLHRVATKDGRIVGFVHATKKEDGTQELNAIYTDPETFGTGLGDQLMTIVDEWLGDRDVELEVAIYNHRAILFYEKHGFVIVPGSERDYSDVIPVVKMLRRSKSQHTRETI